MEGAREVSLRGLLEFAFVLELELCIRFESDTLFPELSVRDEEDPVVDFAARLHFPNSVGDR